ncbi:Plasmodium vivax Vir protein, putative [Plasmodium vivax]|uniref:Vir protein, putative n=1 Tax=Plasmodium vivax TaxID=5855 RepID=A0A1G4E244_PLAVI|nr:Plasmodium vivax Vir protein, putative [Plasmodium vivax]
MKKPETEKYFNYDEYSNLKTDMNTSYSIREDNTSIINDTATKLTINHKYKLNDFIKHLKMYNFYLKRDHAFSQNSNENCCRYINYWINDKVRSAEFKEDNFNYLKEYVEKLAKDNKPHRCYNYIEYINSDLFLKLQKLYHLYDKYYDALEKLKYKNNSFCSDFHLLTYLYSDFINNNYNEKTELYSSRLKDLENRINKTKENDTSTCTGYSFYVSSLQIDPPPQLESPVQVHAQAQESLSPEPLDSTRSTGSDTGDDVPKPSVDEEASGLEKVQEDLSPAGLSRTREFLQAPEKLRLQRFPQGLNETELDDNSGRTLHPEISAYKGASIFQMPSEQQEPKGFLTNVQDTFFSIVYDVEPGPVLGVSGGMGVLFLLFKYTPVGSFLGGRRRRIHQIPGSFRGFPPGNFANFQEYDGGFIGYSPMGISPLAE